MRQAPAIDAFGGGGFRVGGVRIEGSILILDDTVRPWPVSRLADLAPADFDPVFAAGREAVEFVLLGAGASVAPPPHAVREALSHANVGLEIMSTAEACRLYNVLAAEGRRLAAALVAVD